MPRPACLALLGLSLMLAPALAQATKPESAPPSSAVSSSLPLSSADAAAQSTLLDRLLRQNGGSANTSVTLSAVPATLPISLSTPIQVQATVRTVNQSGSIYRLYAVSVGNLETTRQNLIADLNASGWLPLPQQIGFRATEGNNFSNFY
jgi:hypothetical protein